MDKATEEAIARLRELFFSETSARTDVQRADLALLLSHVEAMRWRPIEEAPKVPKTARNGAHGPYVLLANSKGVWVGSHCPVFTSGYKPENPWSSIMMNHRHMERYASIEPTHFMPLPKGPSDE